MRLADKLKAQIATTGPMTVADFMTACLHDPQGGYYAVRPAIGAEGDFITAPQVSQMFGELIGLWLIAVWEALGAPSPVILAEAGPGDGTLMGDVARVAKLRADFVAAIQPWLIETSAPLRALQARRLEGLGWPIRWASALEDLPKGTPLLLLANEFLDCLPARQFVRLEGGWAERMVGLGADGALTFGLRPAPALSQADAPLGSVIERSAAQEAFAEALAARLVADRGAALLIDYGSASAEPGDSLQALKEHRGADPLAAPGEVDLTVHVGFPAVLAAARAAGAKAGLISQAELLGRLGLEARAAALCKANPARADQIARQRRRLTGANEMGDLFKAAALWSGCPAPPAFEDFGDG